MLSGFRTARAAVLIVAAAAAFGQTGEEKIDKRLAAVFEGNESATAPMFVLLTDKADLGPASRTHDRAARGHAVVQALRSTAMPSQAPVQALLRGAGAAFTPYWVENVVFVPAGNLGLARALAARPEVASIVPEPVFTIPQVEAAAAAAGAGVEWNVAKIRADQAWSTTTGAGIAVASIDTGVRYTHRALVNQYRGKTAAGFSHKGNWKDPTGVCGATPCDNSNHGTHVMGTMVGDDGLGNQIGVAPGAKWMACKGCANSSTCAGSHLLSCAQWMLDPMEDGSGSNQPDVVNNSWAGPRGDAWFMDFVDSWRAAGIFPAFAAGNTGPACGTAASPGEYPQAFAAGSTDAADAIAGASGRGPSSFLGVKPNVTAPGVLVRSSIAVTDDSYTSYSGTSMASPHVAGAVALVWAAQPQLRGNTALTEQLLRSTAVPLQSAENCGGTAFQAPNNTYGYGRIDALAAVLTTLPPNTAPSVTITSPTSGSTFNCPATVSFTGQASDAENGNLTGNIAWFDNGAAFGPVGGTASKTFQCTAAGTHNITAGVTDFAGLGDTDTNTIQIRLCKAKGAACTLNGECCSGSCSGKRGAKVCK